MKALKILGYGKNISDKLKIMDAPQPLVGESDVLIEVHAASINPIDYKIIYGETKAIQKINFPAPIGFDVSGVVKKTGKSVSKFKVGDEIYARATRHSTGTFAEYVGLAEKIVAIKPQAVNHIEASSLPLVGLTTVQAFDRANAHEGQSVLIHAGSGGIGTFAIQYAKAIGLRVTTTTSSKNESWVKDLDADEVICYDRENYFKQSETYDIVYDTLGKQYTLESFDVVKQGGVVVSIVGPPDKEFADQVNANLVVRTAVWFMNRKVYRKASQKNAKYFRFLTESNGAQLEQIAKMVDEGKIKAVVDRIYPFEQSIEALQYVEKGHSKGKVVLQMF